MTANLNLHGAACRCLLRLWENKGNPVISDSAFIARFLPQFPSWSEQPGVTTPLTLLMVARELGLAEHVASVRDYARVIEEHRAGRSILVTTERVPEQRESPPVGWQVMLLDDADDSSFTVWCPFASGLSDVLPRAPRQWWDRWRACGLILELGAVVA